MLGDVRLAAASHGQYSDVPDEILPAQAKRIVRAAGIANRAEIEFSGGVGPVWRGQHDCVAIDVPGQMPGREHVDQCFRLLPCLQRL